MKEHSGHMEIKTVDAVTDRNKKSYDKMEENLYSIMDAGELLLMYGAEVSRVEDTIMRLSRAYGFMKADVFTITSSIITTVKLSDGRIITQTRRIRNHVTDLGKVAKVNALSRKICAGEIDAEIFKQEIEKIKHAKKMPLWLNLCMYMIISASLSIFFGGTWQDGIAASLSGLVLFAMIQMSAVLQMNSMIQTMVSSAVTGLAVVLLVRAGIGIHSDKIMIGNIMLVIPGIQLTTSLRDMINGDTISGLLNMSEASLKAISIALGFAAVLMIGGGR